MHSDPVEQIAAEHAEGEGFLTSEQSTGSKVVVVVESMGSEDVVIDEEVVVVEVELVLGLSLAGSTTVAFTTVSIVDVVVVSNSMAVVEVFLGPTVVDGL